MPALDQQLQASVAGARWEEAATLHDQIAKVKPDEPGLAEASAKIEPEIKKLREARAEEARHKLVAVGILKAKEMVGSQGLCQNAPAIADAWNKVRLVRKEDPEFPGAVAVTAQLEICRRAAAQGAARAVQHLMIKQREAWAESAERLFLSKGMNVDVTLQGANKEYATLKWALFNKASVYQLTDGASSAETAFLGRLEKIGFKRVSFRDGFDFGLYYDLKPQDETQAGAVALREAGLTAPLALY